MSELDLNTPRKIKEITISNKKTVTSGTKKFPNEINIIPIKITLTPKIKQNLLKSFNATARHKLYQKNENNDINKKFLIKSKKIIMTPKVESNCSNCSPSLTSPSVIIKNFNYNNVYNINIDKEKDKMVQSKIYKNYTYNRPKTTSNFNLKNDMTFNSSIINDNKFRNEKEKKEYSRINSDKNILASRSDLINGSLMNNSEIKYIDLNKSKKSHIRTLFYNIQNNNNKNLYNKDIKRTLSNMTIKTAEIKLDNNYYLPFNPNELYILFEKINYIIISLSKNKVKDIYINCQDFFIFYNKSSLKRVFPSFFNESHKLILDSSINLCLFSLIVIYNLSSENLLTYNLINIIERILLYCKINFALFINQIQIKYKINLGNIFQKYLISKNITNISKEKDLINVIYQNSKAMTNEIKLILNYYKTINAIFYNNLVEKFNNISIQKEDDFINYFFDIISKNDIQSINKICETSRNKKIKINNSNDNSYKSVFSPKRKNAFENLSIKKDELNNSKIITKKLVKRQKNEILKNKIEIPYIKSPPMKKYTLILDLDKTISYKNNKTGEITLRNGLFSFLSGIKPFYEIITFSLEPKNVCDSITNMIEQDKKYFDYKFYKEHSVLYENNLVKDLSLIGRDITKMIIVDDEEVCFKLNKENGIKIAPFNGENGNDNKLFELKKILKEIYIGNYDDLRIALKNYKLGILNKITLN